MKIKLTFLPAEQPEATAIIAAIRQILTRVRIREGSRKPPYLNAYISTEKADSAKKY